MVMTRRFAVAASRVALAAGHYAAFLVALLVVVVWAFSGPLFGFSDTWQLVINTGTTIVTFLMVFLIQNTQNRDALAMQLKLDELIRAMVDADDSLIDAEGGTDKNLAELKARYAMLAKDHAILLAHLNVHRVPQSP